jgi:hypothetical protein
MQEVAVVAATLSTIAQSAVAAPDLIDLFDEFATDAALETAGAPVPYKNGTVFSIARSNNDDFSEAVATALAENRDALAVGGKAATELNNRLMAGIMARTILKGWDNVKYRGKPLPYSVENATTLLLHSDFRVWVKNQSENRQYFKFKLIEEAAKN